MGTSTRGGHLATELLNVELGLKLKQAAPGQENSAILAQSKSSPVSFLSYFKLYTASPSSVPRNWKKLPQSD